MLDLLNVVPNAVLNNQLSIDFAINSESIGYILSSFLSSFAELISSGAHAAVTSVNLDTALDNLTDAFNNLYFLITVLAYIIGLGCITRGIFGFKVFGTQTFASANRGELSGPLVYIMVGALLCLMATTEDIGSMTLLGQTDENLKTLAANNITAYIPEKAPDKWKDVAEVLRQYAYLFGFIAFVRGLIIMSKMGAPGVQPGAFAKGLTHLVGGLLLMHFIPFLDILRQTLGFS